MKTYTLEQVMAMPWPVQEIVGLMMQSKASEESIHLETLRRDTKGYPITGLLETELPTLEVYYENEITVL